MADPGTLCPQCQTALPSDATFCLRCGTKVKRVDAPRTAPASPPARSGTLLGVSMSSVASAPAATTPAPAPAAAPAPAPAAADATAGGPQPKRVANAHATMLGVASPGSAGAAAQASNTSAASRSQRSGTMLGVAPDKAAPAEPQAPAAASTPPVVRGGHTMQGVTAPTGGAMPVSSTGRHRREVMLSEEAKGPAVAPPTPTYDDEFPVQPKRRGPGVFLGVFAVLLLAVAGVAGTLYFRARPTEPAPLAATVRTLPTGEHVVTLTVPGAAAGTRVRHQGTEHPLDAQGRAEFPLTLPPNRAGTLDVPVELLTPSGAAERRSLRFTVMWTAVTDLTKLGDDPPRVHVVFHVTPGASLWFEGTPIRVSGEEGIADLPAPPPSTARDGDTGYSRRFTVRVAPPGGTAVEEPYELRIPRTPLRVTQPRMVSFSSDATVVVNGTAPHATRVRIGTQAATLTGDNFSAVVPLATGSNALDVVAFAPGGAPAQVNVTVYRSVTPQQYLATGTGGDRGVEALKARPPVDGTRLSVRGTFVGQCNDVPEGRLCQLVVDDRTCPGGHCTAFVNVPPDATVAPNSRMEVIGEVRGTRSYSTAAGERRTDPVVQAVVLNRAP